MPRRRPRGSGMASSLHLLAAACPLVVPLGPPEELPLGSGGGSVGQLYRLDLAIGRALNQYKRDADTSRLHQRCEELRSEAQALTADEPGSSQARTLLLDYLESLQSVTADPWNQPQLAFDALNQQIQGFREALKSESNIPPVNTVSR